MIGLKEPGVTGRDVYRAVHHERERVVNQTDIHGVYFDGKLLASNIRFEYWKIAACFPKHLFDNLTDFRPIQHMIQITI